MVRLTSLKTGVHSCQVRSRKSLEQFLANGRTPQKSRRIPSLPPGPRTTNNPTPPGQPILTRTSQPRRASSPPPADSRPASGRDERLETAVAAAATAPAAVGVAADATPDPQQQQQQQQPQKIVLPASVQCPIVTIYSAPRGGLLGFGFGAISGAWQAYQFGAFDGYS